MSWRLRFGISSGVTRRRSRLHALPFAPWNCPAPPPRGLSAQLVVTEELHLGLGPPRVFQSAPMADPRISVSEPRRRRGWRAAAEIGLAGVWPVGGISTVFDSVKAPRPRAARPACFDLVGSPCRELSSRARCATLAIERGRSPPIACGASRYIANAGPSVLSQGHGNACLLGSALRARRRYTELRIRIIEFETDGGEGVARCICLSTPTSS